MKKLCTFVGAAVLVLYVLAWFDVVDFSLCIGIPGSCSAHTLPVQSRGASI